MNFEKEVKLLQLQVSDILRKIKAKSTSWGQLLGDIRNQKDLMRYFGLKQDLLKSGKNIKTINGSSLLGSGNLQVDSSLGFTPENVANKATDFTTINHTLYPSVEAVKEQLELKQDALTNPITGTGTINRISKFTAIDTIGDSQILDNGTNVGIGTTSPQARLDVRAQGALSTNIVFRVRNSTDTQNFLVVNGAGDVYNNGAGGINTNTFFGANVGRLATGVQNTAVGNSALYSNTTGVNNTTVGHFALYSNTTGVNNMAIGTLALFSNTTSGDNTAIGTSALQSNTIGNRNTAIGRSAGRLISNGSNNTIINNSVFIGADTRALNNSETNQIVIGHNAIGLGSNSVVLGNNSITITQLRGQVIMGSFASAPTGIEGAIYYNSTTKKHYGFDGTNWNALYLI